VSHKKAIGTLLEYDRVVLSRECEGDLPTYRLAIPQAAAGDDR
jgi:hypothetical protein